MNKCSKKWLLAAVILTIAGALVFVGALSIMHFDFTKFSTQKICKCGNRLRYLCSFR